MNFIESFLTAVALSTDAFACSVIYGKITGTERFKGKPVVKVPVSVAIKSPEHLLKQIEQKLKK